MALVGLDGLLGTLEGVAALLARFFAADHALARASAVALVRRNFKIIKQ